MKKFTLFTRPVLLVSCVIFFSITASAQQEQTVDNPDPNQINYTGSPDGFRLLIGNFNSPGNKPGIDDNTLLYPGWLSGVVNFKNGQQLRDAELKFDLVRNELYFKKNNALNTFVEPVSGFFLVDSSGGINKVAVFKKGYPAFGQRSDKTYYLVLAGGRRFDLLKYVTKNRRSVYEYGGPPRTEYRISEDLFIYDVTNNSLHLVNNTASSIKKALPVLAPAVDRLLQNKNGKHFDMEELVNLINQVNNLDLPVGGLPLKDGSSI